MYEIVFSEQGELDLLQIGEWYKAIREGLELEFLICVEAEIEIIKKAPLLYKEYYAHVRKAITSKFPYGIYYLIENNKVIILGIAHHKRGQKAIKKKLKK